MAEFPDEPNWRFSAEVSDCGNFLVFYIMYGCNDSLLYFADLRKTPEIKGKLEFTKVVTKFEAGNFFKLYTNITFLYNELFLLDYEYITNEGSIFFFRTNKGAPNYRIISIDFNHPEESNWKTLIEEHPKNVLDWACCVHENKLALHYMVDVKSVLEIHSLESGKFEFKFKLDYGCIQGFSGDKNSSEIFFHFVSFLVPGIIYHYDFAKDPNDEPKIFKEVKIKNFDSSLYKVEQKFYPSNDGEKIPMFIIKRNENENVARPCLLYG